LPNRKRASASQDGNHSQEGGSKRGKNISVSGLGSLYGKISTFPKKQNAFARWLEGERFFEVARTARFAEATAQVYVIDMISRGTDKNGLLERLIRELEIEDESLEKVYDLLCRSGLTLREIRDTTLQSYNQIWAIIALFINGYEL
ncbi:unnamed protein product, partial [Porites lobata]